MKHLDTKPTNRGSEIAKPRAAPQELDHATLSQVGGGFTTAELLGNAALGVGGLATIWRLGVHRR